KFPPQPQRLAHRPRRVQRAKPSRVQSRHTAILRLRQPPAIVCPQSHLPAVATAQHLRPLPQRPEFPLMQPIIFLPLLAFPHAISRPPIQRTSQRHLPPPSRTPNLCLPPTDTLRRPQKIRPPPALATRLSQHPVALCLLYCIVDARPIPGPVLVPFHLRDVPD